MTLLDKLIKTKIWKCFNIIRGNREVW